MSNIVLTNLKPVPVALIFFFPYPIGNCYTAYDLLSAIGIYNVVE